MTGTFDLEAVRSALIQRQRELRSEGHAKDADILSHARPLVMGVLSTFADAVPQRGSTIADSAAFNNRAHDIVQERELAAAARREQEPVPDAEQYLRSLAKWVGVADDAPLLDLTCEISAALESWGSTR